jgi:riboflavin synthase alpha subunit
LRPGDEMNLEADVIAKYVERIMLTGSGGLTLEKLAALGYAK